MAATDQRRRTSRVNDGDSTNLESVLQDEGDWSAIRRALKNRGGFTNAAVVVSLLHQNEGRACDEGDDGSRSLGEKDEGRAHRTSNVDEPANNQKAVAARLAVVREEKPRLVEGSSGGLDSPPRSPSTDEAQNRPRVMTVVTQDLTDDPRPERRKRSAARRLMGRGSSTFRASLKNRLSRANRSSSGSLASSTAGSGSVNIMDFGVPSHVPFTESMLSLASSASGGASVRRRSSGWGNNLADSCADLVDSSGFLNWKEKEDGSDVKPASHSMSNLSQDVDEQGFLGRNNRGACTSTDSNRPTDLTGSDLSQDVDEDGFLGWDTQTARSSTKSEAWNIEDYEGLDDPTGTPNSEGRLSKLIKGVSANIVERLTAQNELEHFPDKSLASTEDILAKDNDKTVEVRTALLRRISIEKGVHAEEEENEPSGLLSVLRRRKTISMARPISSRRASVESKTSRTVFFRRASVESDYSRKASGGSSTDMASYSRKSSRQSALSNERGGYNLRGSTAINIRNEDGVDINAMRKELLEALPSDRVAGDGGGEERMNLKGLRRNLPVFMQN